jgi:hypothetical protein
MADGVSWMGVRTGTGDVAIVPRGYRELFVPRRGRLVALVAGRIYSPDDVEVDAVAHSRATRPGRKDVVIFALRSLDGVRGTLTIPVNKALLEHGRLFTRLLGRIDATQLAAA